ncbi:MAG TPA: ACT domain-containing protein [Methanocorpusculum sp.]|nr:ACT domain-containing protein [Methanocorpusculum sp.]HJJ39851.1 ACT domain-containing protein [Methanocorpusculum sp.]HJJ49196.1 ACT domain-containing protein [Methanocorpusculum sp.]HJJ56854.1 ACT domain-containing protein [Methanocorpusculum sp.]HJJ95026.1 ACT domain-containing protein [Methanocorpusculum sp.]
MKVIITVVGKDTVGIIARICTYLSNNHVNVEDISQTVVQGYFNMMMIVDTSKSSIAFGDMAEEMDKIGEDLGMKIHCQREEIFDRMHRI